MCPCHTGPPIPFGLRNIPAGIVSHGILWRLSESILESSQSAEVQSDVQTEAYSMHYFLPVFFFWALLQLLLYKVLLEGCSGTRQAVKLFSKLNYLIFGCVDPANIFFDSKHK